MAVYFHPVGSVEDGELRIYEVDDRGQLDQMIRTAIEVGAEFNYHPKESS